MGVVVAQIQLSELKSPRSFSNNPLPEAHGTALSLSPSIPLYFTLSLSLSLSLVIWSCVVTCTEIEQPVEDKWLIVLRSVWTAGCFLFSHISWVERLWMISLILHPLLTHTLAWKLAILFYRMRTLHVFLFFRVTGPKWQVTQYKKSDR